MNIPCGYSNSVNIAFGYSNSVNIAYGYSKSVNIACGYSNSVNIASGYSNSVRLHVGTATDPASSAQHIQQQWLSPASSDTDWMLTRASAVTSCTGSNSGIS